MNARDAQDPDDDLEATSLGIRRSGSFAPAELDDTVVGSRAASRATAEPADVEDTLLGSRATPDDTVIAMRRLQATQEIVIIPDDTAPPLPPGANDSTLVSGATPHAPLPAGPFFDADPLGDVEQTSAGFDRIDPSSFEATTVVPRIRRVGVPEGLDTASEPRAASMPNQRILKEPYRPRAIAQDQIFRTQPAPQPLQPQVDGVQAAHQQRVRGRRRLVAMFVIGGVIFIAAIGALAALVATML